MKKIADVIYGWSLGGISWTVGRTDGGRCKKDTSSGRDDDGGPTLTPLPLFLLFPIQGNLLQKSCSVCAAIPPLSVHLWQRPISKRWWRKIQNERKTSSPVDNLFFRAPLKRSRYQGPFAFLRAMKSIHCEPFNFECQFDCHGRARAERGWLIFLPFDYRESR